MRAIVGQARAELQAGRARLGVVIRADCDETSCAGGVTRGGIGKEAEAREAERKGGAGAMGLRFTACLRRQRWVRRAGTLAIPIRPGLSHRHAPVRHSFFSGSSLMVPSALCSKLCIVLLRKHVLMWMWSPACALRKRSGEERKRVGMTRRRVL